MLDGPRNHKSIRDVYRKGRHMESRDYDARVCLWRATLLKPSPDLGMLHDLDDDPARDRSEKVVEGHA